MTNMPAPEGIPARLRAIGAATERLLATVEALSHAEFRTPTVLPDWTRAHVAAHLALNAEGLAGALSALAEGDARPIYASDARRDSDIDELAGADAATIRGRLREGVVAFADAVRRVPAEAWPGTVDRLPGGPGVPATETLAMRHREVEIHHADLGAGYAHHDWPDQFVLALLDVVSVEQAASGPFTLVASDLGRSWPVGDGGPEVTGAGGALGWWLVGRGSGEGLTTDAGSLPVLAPWRRSPGQTLR